jgi:hypothetical protein
MLDSLDQRIEGYCQAVTEKMQAQSPWAKEVNWHCAKDTQPKGTKFLRIVVIENGRTTSVHSFVNSNTGDVLKTGGFKAPAKSKDGFVYSNYNLLEDESYKSLLASCDPYGGYLYNGKKVKA